VTGGYTISTAPKVAYQTKESGSPQRFVEAGLDDIIGESQGIQRVSLKPGGSHKTITGPYKTFSIDEAANVSTIMECSCTKCSTRSLYITSKTVRLVNQRRKLKPRVFAAKSSGEPRLEQLLTDFVRYTEMGNSHFVESRNTAKEKALKRRQRHHGLLVQRAIYGGYAEYTAEPKERCAAEKTIKEDTTQRLTNEPAHCTKFASKSERIRFASLIIAIVPLDSLYSPISIGCKPRTRST